MMRWCPTGAYSTGQIRATARESVGAKTEDGSRSSSDDAIDLPPGVSPSSTGGDETSPGRIIPSSFAHKREYHCRLTFAHHSVRWDSPQTSLHPAHRRFPIARAVMSDPAHPA